ncbi:MAG: protein kinase [Clostridium sp.]|uniref:protein kinase n=1 Tax=Clostridium sp. TaxID=1506 RepID=UPI003049912E
MSRHFTNQIYFSDEIEDIIRSSEFLGKGNNGVVYKINPTTIIKLFNEKIVCRTEYEILKASSVCKSFPDVFSYGDYFIVREFVDGVRMDKYLNHNPLNNILVKNIVNLIEDFKMLNYTKLDIRCKDLYVQSDFTIKVIDPKDNFDRYMPYPQHLMKGIYKRNSLGEFFYYLYSIDIKLYESWTEKFKYYLQHNEII